MERGGGRRGEEKKRQTRRIPAPARLPSCLGHKARVVPAEAREVKFICRHGTLEWGGGLGARNESVPTVGHSPLTLTHTQAHTPHTLALNRKESKGS